MYDLWLIENLSFAMAGAFLLIALGMQFFGFFVIEPLWLGNIIGWAAMLPYLLAALYYLRAFYGTKDAVRNAALVFLAGLLICAACFLYAPQMRPSVKKFFQSIGVDPATGYKPRTHRRR